MSSSKAEGPVTLMPERRMWLTVNGSEEMSVFLSGPDTDVDLFVTLLIETPSTAAEFKDVAKSSINVYNQAGVRLTPRQVLPATDEVLKVCFSKPMATKTRLDPDVSFGVTLLKGNLYPRMTERSPAMLAKDSLKDLDAECDVTFTPIDTKAAILSSEQQSELSRLYDEAQMVEYLTPRLEGLFAPTGRIIANSEDFAFLPVQFHNNQKPDLTLSEPCVYTRKVPRRFVGTIPDRRFAAPAVALLDSVYFIDAKLDLTNHALGELIIHLQLQGDHTHAPHRGVLAGRAGFWLIEVERHVLTHRTCCAWTAGGSVELMQSYLAPLPWNCVTAVCEKLGFTPVDTLRHQGIDSPFLGAGGFGRVFAVLTSNEENRNSSNKDLLAVKCMNGSLPVLTREWSKMHRHAQHCTCDLIAKPVSQIMSVGVIHAFAMIPAGMHAVKRDMLLLAGQKGQRAMRDVFQALRGLHAHPGGPICHGDARLPNLIVARGGHLFWVDLRETDISQSDAGLATLINADCTTLVQSVLAGVQLTANITVAIDSYVAATTTERADLVAGAVYEHLQSLPYGI